MINIRFIFNTMYSDNTASNIIYVYDPNQSKIIVSKLKEYFYDAKIELIHKTPFDEDKIYINWGSSFHLLFYKSQLQQNIYFNEETLIFYS